MQNITAALMTADKTYIAGTYARSPLAVKSGKGSVLVDYNGKEYIDLGSGIAVDTFGVADEEWLAAVTAQLAQVQHTSNLYYTAPQVQLAQMLCEKSGMQKVFFCNSGAEANECAIKTARKYAQDKYGAARPNIITLKNSFHGRTIATLAATGQDKFHQIFGPFPAGFLYADAGSLAQIESMLAAGNVCAVMLEMIQGEGGVNVLEPAFVQGVAALCAAQDVLLVVDEVQTGNGRTGSLYAYMQYGVQPDIVSTAKGLAGGLPFGATLFGAKTAYTLASGDHGSTFGGNPVCAAGALSVLQRLTPQLMEQVQQKGAFIQQALYGAKGVSGVSGMGLMHGIALTDKDAGAVAAQCLAKGVIVLTAHGKLRLLPALNIPQPLLEKALNIIMEVLAQ